MMVMMMMMMMVLHIIAKTQRSPETGEEGSF
jgi:hypothetical protein